MLHSPVRTNNEVKHTKNMSSDMKKPVRKIYKSDEVEETFVPDDECDINDELMYEEYTWPIIDPTGYRFKGKKSIFVKGVESLKMLRLSIYVLFIVLPPPGRRSNWMNIKNRVKPSPGCRTKLNTY